MVQDNGTHIAGVNHDPVLLAVDNALMDHRMMFQNVIYQVSGHHYHLLKPFPLEVMCLFLKNWEL